MCIRTTFSATTNTLTNRHGPVSTFTSTHIVPIPTTTSIGPIFTTGIAMEMSRRRLRECGVVGTRQNLLTRVRLKPTKLARRLQHSDDRLT